MRWFPLALAMTAAPGLALAQQQAPVPADSGHGHARHDSLTREPVSLKPVTITTTPAQRDEPSGATLVTPAAIRETPALNTWDLLRQAAGIEVHQQGQGPGFASDASIRGFSSDHSTDLALWIDGVPINEPVNGHAEGYNDWSLLMPQAVSEIDVLKGPTSALFGNFAMAGVVNVRTIERASGLQFTGSGGANGRVEGSLLTGLDQEGTGAVIAVRGLHDDGWRPHSGYELGQGHARLVQRLSSATTLDAGLELYAADWDSPGFLSDSVFELHQYNGVAGGTDGGFKRHAQERVSLRVVASPTTLWRSTVYATQGRWQFFLTTPPEGGLTEGSGSQTEEEDRRHGFGATSAVTFALPRGDVTAGVESRWDQSDYENWFTTARQRDSSQTLVNARQASGALFVQSSLDLGRHVRATIGGRYDAQDTRSELSGQAAVDASKGIFAPKLGLLVHLPAFGAVYANASRGFRQTDGVITDPTLPFITAWAYEVGAKVDRGPVSAGAALFRIDVSNEQTFDPITLTSMSGGESRRQGLELDAQVRLLPAVRFDADWTFTDARYRHLVTADGDTLDGARVFNTARYVGTAGFTLAPPGARWHVRVSTNAVGPYTPFDEPGVELPSYALLHLSAGAQLATGTTLEIGVRNVLDQAFPELRAGGFVSPGQPRSAYATLRVVH
ncbi:MAG: TonB-dependent receptor [Gemmatimonadales bacterium]